MHAVHVRGGPVLLLVCRIRIRVLFKFLLARGRAEIKHFAFVLTLAGGGSRIHLHAADRIYFHVLNLPKRAVHISYRLYRKATPSLVTLLVSLYHGPPNVDTPWVYTVTA